MRETVSSRASRAPRAPQAPQVSRVWGTPGRARWLRTTALAGALAWVVLFVPGWSFAAHVLWIERIVILGPLVIAPLALYLAGLGLAHGPAARCHALAAVCQPAGAALALVGLYPRPGLLAAALAGCWLLVTALFALCGLARLITRGLRPPVIQELAIDAGLLYLPVGGVWLVASRLGVPFLGFSEPWVMLTAAHFHFAGLAAPVIAGAVGRALHAANASPGWLRAYDVAAAGVMAGPPLVAAGIALWPVVEVVSAVVLSLALLLLTVVTLRNVVPWLRPRLAGALLGVAVSSLLVSMSCACAYALGAFLEIDILLLPTMVWVHGLVNAIGFGAGGLTAFAIATPRADQREPATAGDGAR